MRLDACFARGIFHQLPQRVLLRPAQIVALAVSALALEAVGKDSGDVFHICRRHARVRTSQGKHDGAHGQKSGESIEEIIVAAEQHRRPKARDIQTLVGPAVHGVLALGLVLQVLARCVAAGAQRAHVQQTADAVVAAGFRDLGGQLAMDAGEVLPWPAPFIQDAYEVHDGVATLHLHTQVSNRVHIGLHQLEARNDDQIPPSFTPACEHPYLQLAAAELATEMASDEPGTSEHAYFSNGHRYPSRAFLGAGLPIGDY